MVRNKLTAAKQWTLCGSKTVSDLSNIDIVLLLCVNVSSVRDG